MIRLAADNECATAYTETSASNVQTRFLVHAALPLEALGEDLEKRLLRLASREEQVGRRGEGYRERRRPVPFFPRPEFHARSNPRS